VCTTPLTDAGSNKVLTNHQAFKKTIVAIFVMAMEKEVLDHEGCGHWDLFQHSTIPIENKVIKAIWSFK
jgi:hypothetical protein